MDYYQIAKLIPNKHRRNILEKNHIYKAVVDFNDWDMMQLYFYYSTYIEADNPMYAFEIKNGKIVTQQNCLICLRNMLDKWEIILPSLVELEKEYDALNSL